MKQNENSTNENDHKLLTRYSATACMVVIFVIWNENRMERWLMETGQSESECAIMNEVKTALVTTHVHFWWLYECAWIMGHFSNYWSWPLDYIPASVCFKWLSARQFGKVCRTSVSRLFNQNFWKSIKSNRSLLIWMRPSGIAPINHGKYQKRRNMRFDILSEHENWINCQNCRFFPAMRDHHCVYHRRT